MALCMAVWSTCKNCYCVNCPQFGPYASVHYGGKYSQKKSLTVEWILMLTQKQRPVISAGIKSKGGQWVCESLRGTIYSNLCASPTWKWASKELRITGKRAVKAHVARALDLTSSHQRLLTIGFQNMDHSQNSTWSEPGVLNPQPSSFNGSHPTAQPRRTEALFWILLLVASTALACCSFYSARHRMAERSTSSWQRRQIAVPSFTLHSTATPKESRLFIYNLLWKSPALHCDK